MALGEEDAVPSDVREESPHSRPLWGIGWTLAVLNVALHVAALNSPSRIWGADFYAFLPPAALWVALLGVLGSFGLALARRDPPWPWRPTRTSTSPVTMIVLGTISFLVFWFFREAHTLLGDGHPLTENLPRGQRFHPDEPLALMLHHWFYQAVGPLFASRGQPPTEVARSAVALSSALAGGVFVPVVWAITHEVGAPGDVEDTRRRSGVVALLILLVLVGQGCLELFFGYVENYTVYFLVVAAYVLTALRYLRGGGPLVAPAVLLVLATAFHLSGAVLGLSFLVLLWRGLANPSQRAFLVRDLTIAAVCFGAVTFLFMKASPGYNFAERLAGLIHTTKSDSSYGFTRPGPEAFLNEQVLIGPLGLFLFLPVAVWRMSQKGWRDPRVWFAPALGLGYTIASYIAGGSNLGDARNWDLLAPAGFVLTFSGLDMALLGPWSAAPLRRWLTLLAAVSLFHTVPWIAVNASFDRSFARLKILPLGLGRAQATVGAWYLAHGHEREAAVWFQKALDENPRNNLAAYDLGTIAMRHRDYAFATEAFWAALQVRPWTETYRFGLADALLRSQRLEQAAAQFDTLLQQNRSEPRYWAGSSVTQLGLGNVDSALADLTRAERLDPHDRRLEAMHRSLVAGEERPFLAQWGAMVRYEVGP